MSTRSRRSRAGVVFLGRTGLRLVCVLVLATFLVTLLLEFVPGDPAVAMAGEGAPDAVVDSIREKYNLDDPVITRYFDWVARAVQGDLGTSLSSQTPVTSLIRDRLPVSVELGVLTLLLALVIAIPLGVWTGYRPGSRFDTVVNFLGSTVMAFPHFVVALLVTYAFGVVWQVFPVTGWTPLTEDPDANLRSAFLPVLALALREVIIIQRVLRVDIIDTLQQDFVLAGRATGLPTRTVVLRHALRPSMFSVITLAGLSLGSILGGIVIIETVFALPGVGRLLIDSVLNLDLVVVQGVVAVSAVVYLVVNLLVDLLYAVLDPRIGSRGER